jgi:hypothetical protein
MKSSSIGVGVFVAWLSLGTARAEEVLADCSAPHPLDKYQRLRRLSLDLRGRIPSVEEYQALDALADIPQSMVDGFIADDAFRKTMRRLHEELFWPNLTLVGLSNTSNRLVATGPEGATLCRAPTFQPTTADPACVVPIFRIASSSRGILYRGGDGRRLCGTFEQTHFLDANFTPDPAFFRDLDGDGVKEAEGYRWISPYWAPANRIKVCAFDAQEAATAPTATGPAACNTLPGTRVRDCGCGPDLRFCFDSATVRNQISASLREQIGRSVDEVTAGTRPYTDLLLSRKAQVNGPLTFWKRYLVQNGNLTDAYNLKDPQEVLPAKGYLDQSWTEVDRGGIHAGVATLPAYLLKFQTNRGRANRFRIDFACSHYTAPADPKPEPGCSNRADDLTNRCICQSCHERVEPTAAHWGGFAEAGSTQITNRTLYPVSRPECKSSNDPDCRRFYVTDPEEANVGTLRPFQFADAHPEYKTAIAGGPRLLAQKIINSGEFAQCTVQRAFAYLMKRDIRAFGEESDELALLEELSKEFTDPAKGNWRYQWLVKRLISRPEYGSVR